MAYAKEEYIDGNESGSVKDTKTHIHKVRWRKKSKSNEKQHHE